MLMRKMNVQVKMCQPSAKSWHNLPLNFASMSLQWKNVQNYEEKGRQLEI